MQEQNPWLGQRPTPPPTPTVPTQMAIAIHKLERTDLQKYRVTSVNTLPPFSSIPADLASSPNKKEPIAALLNKVRGVKGMLAHQRIWRETSFSKSA